MGITKSFFSEPIIVGVTLHKSVKSKSGVEVKKYPAVFTMNRETVNQRNDLEIAASLFDNTENLSRFCRMLATEPEGFDDFPKGKKPLEERALEYFGGGGWDSLINHVVLEVERAQKPLEFFRSF
jgi:hypothetical protein